MRWDADCMFRQMFTTSRKLWPDFPFSFSNSRTGLFSACLQTDIRVKMQATFTNEGAMKKGEAVQTAEGAYGHNSTAHACMAKLIACTCSVCRSD